MEKNEEEQVKKANGLKRKKSYQLWRESAKKDVIFQKKLLFNNWRTMGVKIYGEIWEQWRVLGLLGRE